MSRKYSTAGYVLVGVLLLLAALFQPALAQKTAPLSPVERLGKALFFDQNLSLNRNQSCATCHDPSVGFTGPDSSINLHGSVYPGSDPALFGNRRPPSAAYAGDSGPLHYDEAAGGWFGGMFWDGRADGSVLDDPLAEQAMGPYLNPLEQALDSAETLCARVDASSYAALFEQVWGTGSLDCANAAGVYELIGRSVAAYERSVEVSPFTSKFDKFWDRAKGKRLDVTRIGTGNYTRYRNLGLTDTELYGLALFNDPTAANCASCHSLQSGSKGYPLFTDFGYDNIGLPRNPENPFYQNLAYNPEGAAWTDLGLGGFLGSADQNGKVKVPTLRNVDKRPYATFVKSYGHNGSLKSLNEVVRFYIARAHMDGMGGGMMGGGMMGGGGMGGMCMTDLAEPEVGENLAALTMFPCHNQSYLVAFLKTLSDGYFTR